VYEFFCSFSFFVDLLVGVVILFFGDFYCDLSWWNVFGFFVFLFFVFFVDLFLNGCGFFGDYGAGVL
ncbi:hypothetical protein NQU36_27445, partial [Escherichia coli]|uniref:hypothetical protein n=1 Tax=Escherichia coli TaxID=562 RepID=UPI0021180226